MPPTLNATDAKPPEEDFSGMDRLFEETTPEPSPAPAPAPEATKPPVVETPKPEPQTPKLGDDLDGLIKPKVTPAEKPKTSTDVKPPDETLKTPKALREAYEKVKTEREERDKRIAELEVAVQRAADEGRTKAESTLQAKLDAIIKERDEYATKVNFLDYKESTEYKDKYETPWKAAWKSAQDDIEGLEITVGDTTRPATAEDLFSVVNLPTAQARQRAKELFPEAHADIMRHRAEILRINEASQNAIKEWREKGSQLRAKEAEEIQAAQREFGDTIQTRVKELAELAPEMFGDKFDDEVKPFVEKSQKVIDLALGRASLPPGATPQEIVRARAKATGDIVARVRQFPRLVHQNQKLTSRIAELEAKIAEFEKSEPTTDPVTDGSKNGGSDDLSGFDKAFPG